MPPASNGCKVHQQVTPITLTTPASAIQNHCNLHLLLTFQFSFFCMLCHFVDLWGRLVFLPSQIFLPFHPVGSTAQHFRKVPFAVCESVAPVKFQEYGIPKAWEFGLICFVYFLCLRAYVLCAICIDYIIHCIVVLFDSVHFELHVPIIPEGHPRNRPILRAN